MCGIAGFAGRGGLDDLDAMARVLVHRGPDDRGTSADPEAAVFLGHTRLSILDHTGGAQPMSILDGRVTVVFNGEIYNHRELRDELSAKGHVFQSSHSDTEVLLHGYREWRDQLPTKLNGMWAFAIYDRDVGRLLLSRDRFGQKPLFYTCQHGTFVFASELSAVLQHSSVQGNLSTRGLKKYFAYGFIPSPCTLYEAVNKLPAGHNLVVDVGSLTTTLNQYWDYKPEPFTSLPADPEGEWGEQLRFLLEQAVARRLEADVPLGVFLSGGIDSSSITAFASRHRAEAAHRLETFSIGFDEESFDESRYFNLVAALFETQHHAFTCSPQSVRDSMEQTVSRLDEPMGDSSLLPMSMLCRETRRHVTVALSGDGGDELFAGYDPFRALRWADLYQKLVPKPLHVAVRLAASRLPTSFANMSLDFKVKKTLQGLSYEQRFWNPVWLGVLEPAEIVDLLCEPCELEDVFSEAVTAWDQCPQTNLVDRTMHFYIKLYLQDDILVKADRASMMHSLEVRAPFLDIDLVEFVRRVPYQYKLRGSQTKYILKKALEPVLPSQVIYRPKKGFGVPLATWFQDWQFDLRYLPEGIDRSFLTHRIEQHQARRCNDRGFLWNITLLNLHLERALQQTGRAPSVRT